MVSLLVKNLPVTLYQEGNLAKFELMLSEL